MSNALVECFTPRFELVDLVKAADVTTTWVWNDIGTAELTVATSEPKVATITAPGSILRVNRPGVPQWVGIATGRSWKPGAVTLQLKSAERLLKGQVTAQGLTMTTGRGAAAYALFQSAVQRNSWTPLRAGAFDASGFMFGQYDYADLFDAYQKLTESGGAFWVDENLHVHFRDWRGTDKTNSVVLYENKQFTVKEITEDYEDIVTNIVALGDGNDILSKVKKLRTITNSYWRSAKVVDFRGVVSEDELMAEADAYLRTHNAPRTVIDCTVLNVDNIWSAFDVGDTIRLVLSTRAVGEVLDVVVIGRELQADDQMRCLFQDITPVSSATINPWFLI